MTIEFAHLYNKINKNWPHREQNRQFKNNINWLCVCFYLLQIWYLGIQCDYAGGLHFQRQISEVWGRPRFTLLMFYSCLLCDHITCIVLTYHGIVVQQTDYTYAI